MSGRLALTFDDGYIEDYADLWPVLRERDAPASLAINPTTLGDEGHLSVDQLRELVDDGWEVMAHGRNHRYLAPQGLAADATAGDDRVVVEGGHVFPDDDHGVIPGDEFEVTDGERTETHVLAEKGDSPEGPTLTFEAPLDSGFAADESVVRPTEAHLADEIGGVDDDLRELGFDPTTFVLPYDAGDARVWRVVAEHYHALADAAVRSLPNPPNASPLDLRRYYLETDHARLVDIEAYLDLVAERDGLGILAGHSAWETVPPERVGAVVDAARERDVEVTTVGDAV